jgi:hypothetical protein
MTSWRMTIPWMMGLVVACAVWSAWLLRPTFHTASFAFTTMLTVLLIALLQLRYGRNRAFWFGFVVFGWGYALVAFAPGAWTQIRPQLLTSHPLGDLADALKLTKASTQLVIADPNYYRVILEAGLNPWFATVEGDRFQRIGHSFAAILHGVAGGLLAAWFAARRRREIGEDALGPR